MHTILATAFFMLVLSPSVAAQDPQIPIYNPLYPGYNPKQQVEAVPVQAVMNWTLNETAWLADRGNNLTIGFASQEAAAEEAWLEREAEASDTADWALAYAATWQESANRTACWLGVPS